MRKTEIVPTSNDEISPFPYEVSNSEFDIWFITPRDGFG